MWHFMILPKIYLLKNITIKLNSRTWMFQKFSVVIFQALEPLQPHWPHRPLQPHWAHQHLQPYFIKKLPNSDGSIIPGTKMTNWSLFVEWIIKKQIFHWYLIPFLSEAVEVSQCYFFENWLMKLKLVNLLNTLFNKIVNPSTPQCHLL